MLAFLRKCIPPLVIGGLFAALCAHIYLFGWTDTWAMLHIPTMFPPFADMRTVQGALETLQNGFNPQLQNPGDPWQRAMNYPMVWVDLAKLLNIREEFYYFLMSLSMVLAYVVTCITMAWHSRSLWAVALFCSFSSLLLMERGNNDLIIIALLAIGTSWRRGQIGLGFIALAAALKIYPGIALAAFTRTRLQTALACAAGLLALATFYDQIETIRQSTPVSAGLSYGTASLLALLTIESATTKWLVNVGLVAGCFVLSRKIKIKPAPARDEDLFIAAASIYVGTFIIGSNFDYRLSILILTLPWLMAQSSSLSRHMIPLLLVMAMNQTLWMEALGQTGLWINVSIKTGLVLVLGSILFHMLLARLSGLISGNTSHTQNISPQVSP